MPWVADLAFVGEASCHPLARCLPRGFQIIQRLCDESHLPSREVDGRVDEPQMFRTKLDDVLLQPVHGLVEIEHRQSNARLQRVVCCGPQQTRGLNLKAFDECESCTSMTWIIHDADIRMRPPCRRRYGYACVLDGRA
jgi:hypothetical protein